MSILFRTKIDFKSNNFKIFLSIFLVLSKIINFKSESFKFLLVNEIPFFSIIFF